MIDFTYFGYGVAIPLVGYLCGAILGVVLRGLDLGIYFGAK